MVSRCHERIESSSDTSLLNQLPLPARPALRMGGHSTTGRHRSKRPDARLTAKQRRAQKAKEEDAKAAADLRVVKIKKSERKERGFDKHAMKLKKPKMSPVQKKVKALERKLFEIVYTRTK